MDMKKGEKTGKIIMEVPGGKTWRIGVVGYHSSSGLGGHGTHLAFSGLPGVEIVSVADPDAEGRNMLQSQTGAKSSYSDWRQLLENDRPDVVCVCSRLPSRHTDVVIAAAQAGIHVYCEKPFAEDLEDADRMIEAADSARTLIAVGHLGRYAPMFRTAREMIQNGDIGRPLSVFCRGKEDGRGGGEDMIVLGTHLFDLCSFFFGTPEWVFGHVTVNGRKTTLGDVHEPTEPVGPVAGDEIAALFGFAGGVRGYFESRRGLFDGHTRRMSISIAGSDAVLFFRFDGKQQLLISRGRHSLEKQGEFDVIDTPFTLEVPGASPLGMEGPLAEFPFAYCNRYAAVDLLCAAEERRQPLSSARDAIWTMEIISGVYASHLSGRALNLPLPGRRHPLSEQQDGSIENACNSG